MGGTADPHLNITYNYHGTFYRLWPKTGVRSLYGMTASEIVKELDDVIPTLHGEPDTDYWAATEGNAKAALISLRDLARLCPPESRLTGD